MMRYFIVPGLGKQYKRKQTRSCTNTKLSQEFLIGRGLITRHPAALKMWVHVGALPFV